MDRYGDNPTFPILLEDFFNRIGRKQNVTATWHFVPDSS
jgi:hypothetical protein